MKHSFKKTWSLALLCSTLLYSHCTSSGKKPILEIEKGKVGMIGYGSLMALESMESTLERKYDDSVYMVHLDGYIREWNYAGSNKDPQHHEEMLKYDGFYIRGEDTLLFEKSMFINITPKSGSRMNCVLYLITPEELDGFDRRELGYERIDVTDQLSDYKVIGGKVFAYRAMSDYVFNPTTDSETSIIDQAEIDLIERACTSLGETFKMEYNSSTRPPNPDLIAPVIWKKMR